ncbi:MAG: D-alanyl-D-alanine carboxypeptidase [Armatimonadota bacterium]
MITGTLAASIILAQKGWGAALDDSKLKGAIVGAVVMDTSGKVLFERNGTTRLMPASNEKLVTCAFALNTFGPEKKFTTRFMVGPMVAAISAEGDPTLTPERLAPIREMFVKNNVYTVELWEAYHLSPPDSWQIGDLPNRYAPVVHALTFEKAGVEAWLGPNGISFKPYTPRIDVDESDVTDGQIVPKYAYNPGQGKIRLNMPRPSADRVLDTISDPSPSDSVLDYLVGKLEYKRMQNTKRPYLNQAQEVYLNSPPLKEIEATCLQKSDNCLAEHLYANANVNSKVKLTDWLSSIGWEKNSFKVADGSGLSRKNNVTTANMAKLLKWSYDQPTRQIWLDSLARPGVGTLANRLKGTTFFGKTGTLDMVSALSGYVQCKDGSLKIVSVIVNHYGCSAGEAQSCIDRFIENVRG